MGILFSSFIYFYKQKIQPKKVNYLTKQSQALKYQKTRDRREERDIETVGGRSPRPLLPCIQLLIAYKCLHP